MERFNDILNNLKERFSNPLIFSFICSWLVVNWQITIGLVWHDTKEIEKTGFTSVFEFINDKINIQNCLWHPLSFALAYTLLMPTIKNLIQALNSWTAKWGDNWNFKILDGGKISINKYLQLRADHKMRSKILEDVISQESAHLNEYNKTKTELLAVQTNLNEITQKLNNSETYIRQLNDSKILNGAWENNYRCDDGTLGIENVLIDRDMYFVISSLGDREHKFNIRDFYYDNGNGNVFFVKEEVNGENRNIGISMPKINHHINRLRFEGKDSLIGIEDSTTRNGITRVAYRRK